jgi:threonine dehydrogenase-like Zn-dependent dehydrogenase
VTTFVAGVRTLGGRVEMLEVDDPRPLAADEALIDIRSAGVGNWDDIIRTGGWDVGTGPPLALGVEAAGVSMPTPRSCSLNQAASALAQVVAGHEFNGVVVTKDISRRSHYTPKEASHHQGVSR